MRVAVGGLHLHHAFADFQNRDVECAASEVIDGNGFVLLLVEPVSQSGRRRLIDDAENFQPRDSACILRRLPLAVVEVSRDGNHGLRNLFTQILLGGVFHLLENHGGDFRRRVFLPLRDHAHVSVRPRDHFVRDSLDLALHLVEAAAHKTLDGINRVFRIGDGLPLGRLSYPALTGLCEGHHRWCRPATLRIGDDHGLAPLHYRNNRVCSPKVNPDNLAHDSKPPV